MRVLVTVVIMGESVCLQSGSGGGVGKGEGGKSRCTDDTRENECLSTLLGVFAREHCMHMCVCVHVCANMCVGVHSPRRTLVFHQLPCPHSADQHADRFSANVEY